MRIIKLCESDFSLVHFWSLATESNDWLGYGYMDRSGNIINTDYKYDLIDIIPSHLLSKHYSLDTSVLILSAHIHVTKFQLLFAN